MIFRNYSGVGNIALSLRLSVQHVKLQSYKKSSKTMHELEKKKLESSTLFFIYDDYIQWNHNPQIKYIFVKCLFMMYLFLLKLILRNI